jgi:thiamine biosynthesis lipoprotein
VIQATVSGIERLLSTWDPAAELSRFNTSTSLDPFPVAPETFEAFRWAATLSAETGGAMDPTVGPLVDAWGFGADRSAAPPDDATVERLRADVGMTLVELDPAGTWVRKRRPGVRCSFNAFVPGWAADRIASQLATRGYGDFLVDVGGELVARGRNADGQPWQVAIERPQVDGRSVERVVALDNVALATSGDYRNFRDVAGGRLPHILDPRTGRPVRHALASVSVLAPEAVRADALSTALMVMGPDDAMAFARARGLAVLLLVRTDDGRVEARTSPGFAEATE